MPDPGATAEVEARALARKIAAALAQGGWLASSTLEHRDDYVAGLIETELVLGLRASSQERPPGSGDALRTAAKHVVAAAQGEGFDAMDAAIDELEAALSSHGAECPNLGNEEE